MLQFLRSCSLTILALTLLATSLAAGERIRVPDEALGSAQPVTLAELIGQPDRYVGRTIRVEGRIADVCPRAGCWIDIGDDEGRSIRFQGNEKDIVFDLAQRGRRVIAEGVLRRLDLTREEAVARARHLAQDRGKTFDPEGVTGPATVYQIEGTGAVVH